MALADLFQHILEDRPDHEGLNAEFPFYPLNSPGMPLPGPDFERHAHELGDETPFTAEGRGDNKRVVTYGKHLHYLYRRALYDECFQMDISVKGRLTSAQFVPGHTLAGDAHEFGGGPIQSKVMVIGKHPGYEEVMQRANFVGPTSEDFHEALNMLGLGESERQDWYITNLVKFPQLDRQSDGVAVAWIKDCLPLLHQELRLVRPDYILCLGSHASKALLGNFAAVSNMVGRVEDYVIPLHDPDEEPRYHTAKVMACTHPAAVYRRRELFEPFKDQLALFLQLSNGANVGERETDVDHRVIYKHSQLRRIVDEVRADPTRWFIAADAEWHGDHPTEPNAYLRTVQFSTRHGEGITVVLRHQGGTEAFKPSVDHAISELKRLLKSDPDAGYYPRVGGHFFRADLPWLVHNGVDCRAEYMAPDSPEKMRTEGGWDTSLMYHATNESTSYRLEDITARLTTAPRYDKRMDKWLDQYCKKHDMSKKDIEGYGDAPSWALHPTDGDPNYASYDPDVTRRIAVRCMEPNGLLDHDWYGNDSWQPYWVAHRASPAFLEMEMNGLVLDKERVDKLTNLYMLVRSRLLESFRTAIRWPTFNPESPKQCVAFLFGDQYAYRTDKGTGDRIAVRPQAAVTLNLTPIKTTGKRSKMWERVVARGEQDYYTPSADKEVLGILGHEHPLAMMLRDLKFVSQALKHVLRPPAVEDDMSFSTDDDGNYLYDKGLASHAHVDGRVRTHLSQNKETGRASSYRPPLQNISKRREDDYARIMGTQWHYDDMVKKLAENPSAPEPRYGDYDEIFPQPLYANPIRTIFRAAPGHVLVECDYTGAELAILAWMANDPVMIDHVRRNNLPESHPDHYDIHSRQAVQAFNLTCEPTKSGLKKSGNAGRRVAAKNVNFGVPYGRMALAIARQCREEGVDISIDEAQALIDAYFSTYRETVQFLEQCRNRVSDPQWMMTFMRRIRRFVRSHDDMVVGEQERQAQNFPIQGGVADAMSRALDNLYYYRFERPELTYRLLLQIHDAVLFEVPIPNLREFVHDETDDSGNIIKPSVLRTCMVDRVPIWPTFLDGTRRQDVAEPYHFGIDFDVQINWGEDITDEQARKLGIDEDLI